jgi:hypothetical protein
MAAKYFSAQAGTSVYRTPASGPEFKRNILGAWALPKELGEIRRMDWWVEKEWENYPSTKITAVWRPVPQQPVKGFL